MSKGLLALPFHDEDPTQYTWLSSNWKWIEEKYACLIGATFTSQEDGGEALCLTVRGIRFVNNLKSIRIEAVDFEYREYHYYPCQGYKGPMWFNRSARLVGPASVQELDLAFQDHSFNIPKPLIQIMIEYSQTWTTDMTQESLVSSWFGPISTNPQNFREAILRPSIS